MSWAHEVVALQRRRYVSELMKMRATINKEINKITLDGEPSRLSLSELQTIHDKIGGYRETR